jgi:translation initiation factor IF-1
MAKVDCIVKRGVVIKDLSNSNFQVELSEIDHVITCTIAGKLRLNKIRIVTGDLVELEMSPYDLNKGRIIKRLK